MFYVEEIPGLQKRFEICRGLERILFQIPAPDCPIGFLQINFPKKFVLKNVIEPPLGGRSIIIWNKLLLFQIKFFVVKTSQKGVNAW